MYVHMHNGHVCNAHIYTQAQERERINESNVSQLQSTVDRMLNEAKDRQETHSSERKRLMDAKVWM